MDSKLRLAWKKEYEKKLSKEKYIGNALQAAQKALSKIKKMREARFFNITLYRYKGDVKGIKVVPKNPKTPNLKGAEDGAREETDVATSIATSDGRSPEVLQVDPEIQLNAERAASRVCDEVKVETKKEEEKKEDEPVPPLKEEDMAAMYKDPAFLAMLKEVMEGKEGKEEEPEGEEEKEEEEEEEELPPPPIPQRRPRKVQPRKREAPAPPPPPKKVKPLPPPAKPRKIPTHVKQKYAISQPLRDALPADDAGEAAKKPKKDYAFDKGARAQAYRKLLLL